jgi:2-dehydro-3-deoxygluconokinase
MVDFARHKQQVGLHFVELSVPPRPVAALYDRKHSAAAALTAADIAWPVIEQARIVHISGITPALSDSTRALSIEVVQRCRAAGVLVSIDVNYRQNLWSVEECAETILAMARHADLLIATAEDARDVFGLDGTPQAIVRDLHELTGTNRVVVTTGKDGAHWLDGSTTGSAMAYDAEVVDRIGAGDAFAAGTLLGLLDGDLPGGIDRGLAMAALKLGIHGDQLNVTLKEVAQVIGGHNREISRWTSHDDGGTGHLDTVKPLARHRFCRCRPGVSSGGWVKTSVRLTGSTFCSTLMT